MRKYLLLLAWLLSLSLASAIPIQGQLRGPYSVDYVYDGDTISVAGQKVRLLSIDTPESGHNARTDSESEIALGMQAKALTKHLLAGKEVYLEIGPQERDRYGRLLAWVYWPEPDGRFVKDGRRYTMLNYELVARGWADVFVLVPNVRYENVFRSLAKSARERGLGMWKQLSAERAGQDAPLKIVCVIYNPPGPDEGHEAFVLEASRSLDLAGYAVGDDEGFRYPLSGHVDAGRFQVTLENQRPQLSNRGDVALLIKNGKIVDRFEYRGRRGQARACRR